MENSYLYSIYDRVQAFEHSSRRSLPKVEIAF